MAEQNNSRNESLTFGKSIYGRHLLGQGDANPWFTEMSWKNILALVSSMKHYCEMIEKDLIHWGGVDRVNGLMEH